VPIEPLLLPGAAPAAHGSQPTAKHMCIIVGELADGDGQAAVRRLGRRDSQRVILLARRANRRELVSLLSSGLRGAVMSEGRGTLPGALPRPRIPESVRRQTLDLTLREIGVLRVVADGRSNRAIGEELGLSALTVKSHLARISRKLGTGDRAELVAIALRAGLLG
jgi:two-component system nitrate/nitrite response regulator NarL